MKPKRTRQQRLSDLALIERWTLMGKTAVDITALLNQQPGRPYTLTRQQVCYDLHSLEDAWKESAQKDLSEVKARELKGLDRQEAELWDQWERSKTDAEKTSKEQTVDGDGKASQAKGKGRVKVRKETEGRLGEASYMRLILDVRDRRAKLLGLDAPAKQELSGPGGGPMAVQQGQVVIVLPDNGRGQAQPEATPVQPT